MLTPHTYLPLSETLSFLESCLLITFTIMPSDSDIVHRSASMQRFRLIHTTPSDDCGYDSVHSYHGVHAHPAVVVQNLLKTVATRVITGISHCIDWFCEKYWLAGVWCLCYVWWHMLFLINCFGIELVLRDFKLYLMWFVVKKGWSFDTFFIVFFTNCVVVITEYLNSNHFQY